jgi:hypothetical protein
MNSGAAIFPEDEKRASVVSVSVFHWQFPLILQILRFPREIPAHGLSPATLFLNRPRSSPSISTILAHLISRPLNILSAPDALTI